MSYTVVSERVEGAVIEAFADADEAIAYAQSFTPETDGSVLPNLSEAVIKSQGGDDKYYRGMFWLGNRYAVVFNTEANYEASL